MNSEESTSDFYAYVVYICIPFMTALFFYSKYQQYTRPKTDPKAPPERAPRPIEPKWKKRSSHFDSFSDAKEDQSAIYQSDYRGLINLSFIALFFFLSSHHVRHFLKEGTIWGYRSFFEMFTHTGVVATWAILCLMSFTAFPIQKLIVLLNLPRSVQGLLHGSTLTAMFLWIMYQIWANPTWPLIPKASLCAQLMVLFMKIHSYLHNNREFARQAAQSEKEKSETNGSDKKSQERNGDKKTENDESTKPIQYPQNVTLSNFVAFLFFPTLVYELEYPRTNRIRFGYVLEKCAMTVGVMSGLHLISQFYIYPALQRSPNESAIQTIAELVMPFFGSVWLVFYVVFDCICNGLAEITYFADRQFYTDWWNSTTMDEFARSWNKPVHEWLLRHIYLESIENYKMSKSNATFVTFLVSSLLHELVLVCCFRILTPFLFLSQMAQIPLIMLGRDLKGTRMGNCFFWFGIILGVPTISVLYCREYFRRVQTGQETP